MTHVIRDRQWFAEKLPIMDAFWKRVLWHRANGVEDLLKPPRKPRAKKVKITPVVSRIQEYEEDQESSSEESVEEPEEAVTAPNKETWDYAYL